MSLVYLHTCMIVQSFMSRESAALNYAISNFLWLPWKIAASKFATWNFQARSWKFSLWALRKIFRKVNDFSRKIHENKGQFSTNFICITFAQCCSYVINHDEMPLASIKQTLPSFTHNTFSKLYWMRDAEAAIYAIIKLGFFFKCFINDLKNFPIFCYFFLDRYPLLVEGYPLAKTIQHVNKVIIILILISKKLKK